MQRYYIIKKDMAQLGDVILFIIRLAHTAHRRFSHPTTMHRPSRKLQGTFSAVEDAVRNLHRKYRK